MLENLEELGLSPETALSDLESIQEHYDEAIQRLDGSVAEFQKWEDATLESYEEDSMIRISLPVLSRIVELDQGHERKQAALQYAFTLMNESPPDSEIASSAAEDFGYAEIENGFTITPVEYIEHERSERYTLTIGKPSE